jgi:hypothetical protein
VYAKRKRERENLLTINNNSRKRRATTEKKNYLCAGKEARSKTVEKNELFISLRDDEFQANLIGS